MDLLSLPVVVIENIFTYLTYDEIAKNRLVSNGFNDICSRLLNRGFMMIERRHAMALKNVKAQLPRRESERRYHHLSRHCDILTSIETRISMLNMTYSKFIDNGLCCFIPGKVIDEIRRVLSIVETSTTPPRAHEVLQELRDISSMAIEHFDDKISPAFRKRLQEGVAQPAPRPSHSKNMEEPQWPSDEHTKATIKKMLDQMPPRTTFTDELDMIKYFNELATSAANNNDAEEQLSAVEQCRKWFTTRTPDPPFKEMIAAGMIPVLIQCLSRHDSPALQLEATWAITNIAAAPEDVDSIVAAGAIPILIKLLELPNIRGQALWALGNIIADDPFFKHLIIETGLVEILLGFITPDKSVSFLRTISWVMKTICEEDPLPPVKTIKELLSAFNVLITYSDTKILLNTVGAICHLTEDEGSILLVIESAIVPELIPLMTHRKEKVRCQALKAISNIVASSAENKQVVVNCGNLCNCPVDVTQHKDHICSYVAWLLSSIVPRCRLQIQMVIEAGLLVKHNVVDKLEGDITGNALSVITEELLKIALNSQNMEEKVTALEYCRVLLSPFITADPPMDEVIEAGIIPVLVKFLLQADTPRIQLEAAWTLSNIALGTSAQTNEVVEAGAIPVLLQLLGSFDDVRERAIWALTNISADNPTFRDLVIASGVMKSLTQILNTKDLPICVLYHITWFIWKLCSGELLPQAESFPDILTALKVLLTLSENDILLVSVNILLIFSYLSEETEVQIQAIIDTGIVPILVQLLVHTEVHVQAATLRVLLKILQGTEKQKQVVLDCGALRHFTSLLAHENKQFVEEATYCLVHIADNNLGVQEVIDCGMFIPVISENLSKDDIHKQMWAAVLVSQICHNLNETQFKELVRKNIITPFFNLLNNDDEEINKAVLDGLRKILKIPCEEADQIAQLLLMDIAHADNLELQLVAVRQCWKLLYTGDEPPIDEMIAAGMLPILVHCLIGTEDPTLKYEIVCILTNIAAGTLAHKKEIVNMGVVPILIQLLTSPYQNLSEKAIWSLTNLIGDEPVIRDILIEAGVVKPLLSFLNLDTSIFFLREVVKAVVNVCRSKKSAPPDATVNEILQTLNVFILQAEPETLVKILRAIIFLCYGGNRIINMVIKSGIVRKITPLLSHSDVKVQSEALLALGNIVNYTEKQAKVVIESGALSYFQALLAHEDNLINKDAAGFLSIITSFQHHIQSVIDAGLLPEIVEAIIMRDFETQKWAAFAVTNLCCYGTKKQIMALINYDIVPPYCDLLVHVNDTDLICWILDGLIKTLEKVGENIPRVASSIEICGGLEKILVLKNHRDKEIAETATFIIDRFFDEENPSTLDCCVI